MRISKKQIDQWVREAIDLLPQRWLKRMYNLVFVVDDRPTRAQVKECQLRRGYALFGLYQGYEQTNYRERQTLDKVFVFRNAIIEQAKTAGRIKKKVYETVWHEVSHHFGSDEEEAKRAEKRLFDRYKRLNQRYCLQKKEVKKISRIKKGRKESHRKSKVTYKVNLEI